MCGNVGAGDVVFENVSPADVGAGCVGCGNVATPGTVSGDAGGSHARDRPQLTILFKRSCTEQNMALLPRCA